MEQPIDQSKKFLKQQLSSLLLALLPDQESRLLNMLHQMFSGKQDRLIRMAEIAKWLQYEAYSQNEKFSRWSCCIESVLVKLSRDQAKMVLDKMNNSPAPLSTQLQEKLNNLYIFYKYLEQIESFILKLENITKLDIKHQQILIKTIFITLVWYAANNKINIYQNTQQFYKYVYLLTSILLLKPFDITNEEIYKSYIQAFGETAINKQQIYSAEQQKTVYKLLIELVSQYKLQNLQFIQNRYKCQEFYRLTNKQVHVPFNKNQPQESKLIRYIQLTDPQVKNNQTSLIYPPQIQQIYEEKPFFSNQAMNIHKNEAGGWEEKQDWKLKVEIVQIVQKVQKVTVFEEQEKEDDDEIGDK